MPGGVKADVRTYQMYVNGEWVDSKSNKTFPVYDPATEEVIAQVPDANADDVNRAVAAAKAAFENGPWASTTAQERGRVLFRLADKIRQNATMLAELESRNTGKPIVEAEFDIADVATCFEYYGGLATKILGYVNPVPDNAVSLTLKEPIGVAGQIIPWNYPLLMAAWKLAPASGRGLHLRIEARRANAHHRARNGQLAHRRRPAPGRGQHHHRIRRKLWRAAGPASRREQDRFHRQRRRRQNHRETGRRYGEASHPRTRRQVAQHFFR